MCVYYFLKMPLKFSNDEFADIIFIYGYFNENILTAHREYQESSQIEEFQILKFLHQYFSAYAQTVLIHHVHILLNARNNVMLMKKL